MLLCFLCYYVDTGQCLTQFNYFVANYVKLLSFSKRWHVVIRLGIHFSTSLIVTAVQKKQCNFFLILFWLQMEENIRFNNIKQLGRSPILMFSIHLRNLPKNLTADLECRFQFLNSWYRDAKKLTYLELKVQRKFMEVYGELGMHGGLGSMVATHLHWNKCPKELRNLYKGKESYPTLGFNVAVYHFHYIHHASNFYYGTVERYLHRSHHALNDFCRRWVWWGLSFKFLLIILHCEGLGIKGKDMFRHCLHLLD